MSAGAHTLHSLFGMRVNLTPHRRECTDISMCNIVFQNICYMCYIASSFLLYPWISGFWVLFLLLLLFMKCAKRTTAHNFPNSHSLSLFITLPPNITTSGCASVSKQLQIQKQLLILEPDIKQPVNLQKYITVSITGEFIDELPFDYVTRK